MGLLNTCTTASFEHLLMTSDVHNFKTSSSYKDSWLFGLPYSIHILRPTHSSLPGSFVRLYECLFFTVSGFTLLCENVFIWVLVNPDFLLALEPGEKNWGRRKKSEPGKKSFKQEKKDFFPACKAFWLQANKTYWPNSSLELWRLALLETALCR